MPRNPSNHAPIVLTTTSTNSQAAQIIYGLDLRGIIATVVANPLRSKDPIAVVLTKGDETMARAAIESIWDALLESTPRAWDLNGNCFFCGYDITGLMPPTICPECGNELDSIAARRAASEGRPD